MKKSIIFLVALICFGFLASAGFSITVGGETVDCNWTWSNGGHKIIIDEKAYQCAYSNPYCKADTKQCCNYDNAAKVYANCVIPPGYTPKICGNNKKESGEECDGTDLNGKSCGSFDFIKGALSCKSDCTFDKSGCKNEEVNPCANTVCGANSVCSNGVCKCDSGFFDSTCTEADDATDEDKTGCTKPDKCATVDPCKDVVCGSNSDCINGDCLCNDGYFDINCGKENDLLDEDKTGCTEDDSCVESDPCADIICGDNSNCEDGKCICNEGFFDPNCKNKNDVIDENKLGCEETDICEGEEEETCVEEWICESWSECKDEKQTRKCACDCEGGEGCSGDSSNVRSCGETCKPYTKRCFEKDDLQVCSADGKWNTADVCEYGCNPLTNRCNSKTEKEKGIQCDETDMKSDSFVQGMIYGEDEKGNTVTKTDECIGENALMEYTCFQNKVTQIPLECEYGCVDGACRPAENVIVQMLQEAKSWLEWFYNSNADMLNGALNFLRGQFVGTATSEKETKEGEKPKTEIALIEEVTREEANKAMDSANAAIAETENKNNKIVENLKNNIYGEEQMDLRASYYKLKQALEALSAEDFKEARNLAEDAESLARTGWIQVRNGNCVIKNTAEEECKNFVNAYPDMNTCVFSDGVCLCERVLETNCKSACEGKECGFLRIKEETEIKSE